MPGSNDTLQDNAYTVWNECYVLLLSGGVYFMDVGNAIDTYSLCACDVISGPNGPLVLFDVRWRCSHPKVRKKLLELSSILQKCQGTQKQMKEKEGILLQYTVSCILSHTSRYNDTRFRQAP